MATERGSVVRFDSFEMNLESRQLRKNGLRLRLSGQPFQVLTVLVERAGEVVTREELHSKLWKAETFVDFDHGLNNAIARIREVLDDTPSRARYVETIPKLGYRFVAPLLDSRPHVAVAPVVESSGALQQKEGGSSAGGQVGAISKRWLAQTRSRLWLAGAIVALSAAILLVLLIRGGNKTTVPRAITSIAVLPLKNMSGDAGQEYLADGMTEELIGRLAGIHNLRVISRTTVMRFKETKLSAPEIAKALQVDALVEGSIVQVGTRIRVRAQLIRGGTDEHFWSEAYDRQMVDILSLESEVAQSIAERVRVTISGQEHSMLAAARHVSPDVYENYLKGRFRTANSRADLEKSVSYFEAAINKDPTFAPAYVGLASTYVDLGTIMVGAAPAEMRPKAISAALRASELDPDLAEAHALLADVYQTQWQWKNAEDEYKLALKLKPNDAVAQIAWAGWLACHGRIEEAVDRARFAGELDPLGTKSSVGVGWILFLARQFDESVAVLEHSLSLHPESAETRFYLGFSLIGKAKPEIAITDLEEAVSLSHRGPGSVGLLAAAYGYAGHTDQAIRLVNELKQRQAHGYVQAGAFINPYLALRDYHEVFLWLDRAYAEQSNILQFVRVHPFFDPIRADPRFENLIQRIGLKSP